MRTAIGGAAVTATTVALLLVTPSSALAAPEPFPDIDSYASADVDDYTIELPNPGRSPLRVVYFLTPDGAQCSFRPVSAAFCAGNNLPGIPPAVSPRPQSGPVVNSMSTDAHLRHATAKGEPGSVQGHPVQVLPPFHRLEVDGAACGVDDQGTTACKDPEGRAFVLSPNGSRWMRL